MEEKPESYKKKMINALTIDVEDYFQVQAFFSRIRYEDWEKYQSRIERNSYRILDLLNGSTHNPEFTIPNPVKATFFCLGWIAKRYPQLIKEIHSRGHEIACHGYSHQLIYLLSEKEFRRDIRKAKAVLEDITGQEVIGYRAPSYSITNKSLWALGVLAEEGFKYDSSIFPILHDFYGIPNAPRFPFMVSVNGNRNPEFKPLVYSPHSTLRTLNVEPRTLPYILEFPLSTLRLNNFNLPISGGGYFRLFPYYLFKKGLKRINKREGQPFIFYLHPWELDPDQPRIQGTGMRSKFRHYINLNKTETRLKNLLADFRFSSIREMFVLNEKLFFAHPSHRAR